MLSVTPKVAFEPGLSLLWICEIKAKWNHLVRLRFNILPLISQVQVPYHTGARIHLKHEHKADERRATHSFTRMQSAFVIVSGKFYFRRPWNIFIFFIFRLQGHLTTWKKHFKTPSLLTSASKRKARHPVSFSFYIVKSLYCTFSRVLSQRAYCTRSTVLTGGIFYYLF